MTSNDLLSPDSARRKDEIEPEPVESAVDQTKHKRRKSGSPRRDPEEGKERQHSPKLSVLSEGDGDEQASATLNRTSSRRRPKTGEKDKEKDKEKDRKDDKERKEEKERKRRDKERAEKDAAQSRPGAPLDLASLLPPDSTSKHSSPLAATPAPSTDSQGEMLSPRSARSAGWIKISKSTDNAFPGTASNSRHLASNERQRFDLSSSTGNIAQNSPSIRDSPNGSQGSAGTSTNPSPVAWNCATSPRGSNERPGANGTPIPLIRLNSNRILQVQQSEAATRSPRKLTKDLSQLINASIDIDLDGLGKTPKKIPLVFSVEEQNKLELEVEDEMNRIMSSLEFMSV